MKITNITKISIATLLLAGALNAYASLHINGNYIVRNITLMHPLIVNGSVIINGGSFLGGKINGSLRLTGAKVLGSIIVNGSLHATHSTFLKPVEINGLLSSQHSVFENNLIISSDKVILANTTTKNIFIRENNNSFFFGKKKSVIYLSGKSLVNGNIQFTSNGVVYAKNNTKITGHVINGKIITQ